MVLAQADTPARAGSSFSASSQSPWDPNTTRTLVPGEAQADAVGPFTHSGARIPLGALSKNTTVVMSERSLDGLTMFSLPWVFFSTSSIIDVHLEPNQEPLEPIDFALLNTQSQGQRRLLSGGGGDPQVYYFDPRSGWTLIHNSSYDNRTGVSHATLGPDTMMSKSLGWKLVGMRLRRSSYGPPADGPETPFMVLALFIGGGALGVALLCICGCYLARPQETGRPGTGRVFY